MPIVPHRFLFRVAYPCRYVKDVPREEDDRLLELPEACRLDNFAAMDGQRNFADVRLAWNELGFAVQVEVRGKEQAPQGHESRPRGSDGATVWIDTRDARTSHRATRYCHQFHLLPAGGGPDHDEPILVQTKINRALQDAPLVPPDAVAFRCVPIRTGYAVEAFFPAAALNGYDPDQTPRLGICYAVRDAELGEQTLSVGAEFPYWEDPTLWSVLELVR
ncbi:MAG: hypothetical protein IT429_07785 [Gemmataceae bacterium]|nr:hypothetical protein [Gemmataceae bacterium]